MCIILVWFMCSSAHRSLQLTRMEREREAVEATLRSVQAAAERQRSELSDAGAHITQLESARDVLSAELHARRQEVCLRSSISPTSTVVLCRV